VLRAVKQGNFCSLNCPEEVELAELLCALHPWAHCVRYGRGGGEVMAIAIRIARAYTKRDTIAFCGYHGWHDWYLAANLHSDKALTGHLLPGLKPAGVPRGLLGSALPFHYNNINELKTIVQKTKDSLAAIVMEPIRNIYPEKGFLEEVRDLADQSGAVLIFDEVSSGFRLNTGGAHLVFGVNPDIAVFAKAMSNGYPMGAIVGIDRVMAAVEDTFISSTYWTDRIGPVAAIATIQKHKKMNVGPHLVRIGTRIQRGWQTAAQKHNMTIRVDGIAPMSHFEFTYPDGLALMTLFVQEMLKKGFLSSNRCYVNFAHTDAHVDLYLRAVDSVFEFIADARRHNNVDKKLYGGIAKPGFHRLT
jgi:glutamate-1-semialdehyde aminotransferase